MRQVSPSELLIGSVLAVLALQFGGWVEGTGENLYLPKPEARSSKPETRNPKPETRSPKFETRNPKPEARCPKFGGWVEGTGENLYVPHQSYWESPSCFGTPNRRWSQLFSQTFVSLTSRPRVIKKKKTKKTPFGPAVGAIRRHTSPSCFGVLC